MVSFPMSAFLCVAVLCTVALVSGQPQIHEFCQGSCPTGWASFNGRCFQYFTLEKDWAEAESHCVSLGGHLASVHSEEENNFVKKLTLSYNPSDGRFWLGLTDCYKEGTWRWSDGTETDFTEWNPSEPNNANGGENCLLPDARSKWNDARCPIGYRFMCALQPEAK
ncbi:lactose-binding lectin l-2-like [Megalops cyprinoides]|uniref:lactose-binding lectin l-2-like n=1 Tax=Megalops cyprinoides TaxID=118141 RepID=UPI001864E8C9|nr:lactose-binding lectin l-2-like [Megalops cyprinoides]